MITDAIGIEFVFKGYTDHLSRLFCQVPVEEYTWHVACSECYFPLPRGITESFLPKGVYSGAEFAAILHREKEYYILEISLYAVPQGCAFDPNEIGTYEDYVKSPAVLALLCADNEVDFYTKDPNILKSVSNACEQYYSCNRRNEPFRIKTVQNDERTGF